MDEDSPLPDTLRLKMQYQYVCARLEMNSSETWERKKEDVEEKLREKDIEPSTLIEKQPKR